MKRLAVLLILLIASCSTRVHRVYIPHAAKGKPTKVRPTRNPHYPTHTPAVITPMPTGTETPTTALKGYVQPSQYPPNCEMISGWYYNYLPNPPLCPGVEVIPMAWDERVVNTPMEGNSIYVMGPNECDRSDQCDLTYLQLVPVWYTFEQNNVGRKFVAPAVADDIQYLVRMRNAFINTYGRPPQFDVIPVHFYGTGNVNTDIGYLMNKIADAQYYADLWGAEGVWLTEFGHSTYPVEFLQAVLPLLPGKVDRFAWFATEYPLGVPWWPDGWVNTSLWHDGVLTEIGEVYD
jgi:hypothetical protein